MKLHIFLPFLALVVGCATKELPKTVGHSPDPNDHRSWTNISLLKTNLSVAKLNAIIDDPKRSEYERGQAVCTLFANHIKPGMDSKSAQKIFHKARWLDESQLAGQGALGGWIPIDEFGTGGTVIVIQPFSFGSRDPWEIYLLLYPSGFVDEGSFPAKERLDKKGNDQGWSGVEAKTFLYGIGKQKVPVHLIEFSICFPNSRIEHFTKRGMTLY